jgi:hypothetical protein
MPHLDKHAITPVSDSSAKLTGWKRAGYLLLGAVLVFEMGSGLYKGLIRGEVRSDEVGAFAVWFFVYLAATAVGVRLVVDGITGKDSPWFKSSSKGMETK